MEGLLGGEGLKQDIILLYERPKESKVIALDETIIATHLSGDFAVGA